MLNKFEQTLVNLEKMYGISPLPNQDQLSKEIDQYVSFETQVQYVADFFDK